MCASVCGVLSVGCASSFFLFADSGSLCVSESFVALILSLPQASKDGSKDPVMSQARGGQPEKAVTIPLRGTFQRQALGCRLADGRAPGA